MADLVNYNGTPMVDTAALRFGRFSDGSSPRCLAPGPEMRVLENISNHPAWATYWHVDRCPKVERGSGMEIDEDKVDDAVLALLRLTLHDGQRAWKGFDWETLGRLHRKGMISDPVGRAKSVVLTEEGLRRAEELLAALFAKTPDA
jgi:Domain of unknown function (DUF6429)